MVTLKKHFNKSSNSYTLTLRGLSVEHIRMLNDLFFTLSVDPSDVLPLHVCGVSVPYERVSFTHRLKSVDNKIWSTNHCLLRDLQKAFGVHDILLAPYKETLIDYKTFKPLSKLFYE